MDELKHITEDGKAGSHKVQEVLEQLQQELNTRHSKLHTSDELEQIPEEDGKARTQKVNEVLQQELNTSNSKLHQVMTTICFTWSTKSVGQKNSRNKHQILNLG